MPAQTTAAPARNPRKTPAAVETMLDGTGRKTSSASKPNTATATSHCDDSERVTCSANALNCSSKSRNGSRTSPIRISQRSAQRTKSRLSQRTANSQLPTANSQLPTANSQLPTPNSQLPTPNFQLPTKARSRLAGARGDRPIKRPPTGTAHASRELEIGNWKLEIGNWKLEIGNWELRCDA